MSEKKIIFKIMLIVVLVIGSRSALARNSFSIEYEQKEKTDQIHNVKTALLRISYSARDIEAGYAQVTYRYEDQVKGLLKESFLRRKVSFSGRIDAEPVLQLIGEMQKLELIPIARGMAHDPKKAFVVVKGKRFNLPEKYNASAYPLVEDFINNYLVGAIGYLEENLVVAGDKTPSIKLSLKVLNQNPTQYAGKRVQVSGYFINEFEFRVLSSSIPASAHETNFVSMIGIGELSTLAAAEGIDMKEGAHLEIEGTFMPGSNDIGKSRHGELVRITRVGKVPESQLKSTGNF